MGPGRSVNGVANLIQLALGLGLEEEWLEPMETGAGSGHVSHTDGHVSHTDGHVSHTDGHVTSLVLCAGRVCFWRTQRRSWASMNELSCGKLRPSNVDSTLTVSSGSCTHSHVTFSDITGGHMTHLVERKGPVSAGLSGEL